MVMAMSLKMFFPKKIISIKPNDYVLEIGPGGNPFPRSDVLLEKKFKTEKISTAQRGYAPNLKTEKRIVYFDGDVFPFRDKEFDYVICSHVLEHVEDVEAFLKEIFRIAKRGYLEYPLIYYDYIYNIPEHLNFLKFERGKLWYLKKSETNMPEFSCVNKLFYKSLVAGYKPSALCPKKFFAEGFEWFSPFPIQKAWKISDLCWNKIVMPPLNNQKSSSKILKLFGMIRRYVYKN